MEPPDGLSDVNPSKGAPNPTPKAKNNIRQVKKQTRLTVFNEENERIVVPATKKADLGYAISSLSTGMGGGRHKKSWIYYSWPYILCLLSKFLLSLRYVSAFTPSPNRTQLWRSVQARIIRDWVSIEH